VLNLSLVFFLLIRRFERRNDDDVGPVQNGMQQMAHRFTHRRRPVDGCRITVKHTEELQIHHMKSYR
jgi:hypothetical protein